MPKRELASCQRMTRPSSTQEHTDGLDTHTACDNCQTTAIISQISFPRTLCNSVPRYHTPETQHTCANQKGTAKIYGAKIDRTNTRCCLHSGVA